MAGEGTKRIIDLSEAAETQSGDYIAIDSTGQGTRKLPAEFMATAEDLSEEQTARQTADETLDGKITTETENRIAAENALKAQLEVTGTSSGAIATFSDGSTMPAKSVVVNIEPQQSGTGTPSPDNVRPISGWESVSVTDAGKNLLNRALFSSTTMSESNGVYSNTQTDTKTVYCIVVRTIYADGTQSSFGWVNLNAGHYTLAINPTNDVKNLQIIHNGNVRNLGINFNGIGLKGNETYMLSMDVVGSNPSTIGGLLIENLQLELGTTATVYEPYQGQTITKDLGRTVYGATLDVVSGQMVIDRKYQSLNGSEGAWYNYEYAGVNSFRFIPNDMASVQSTEGVIITNEFTFRTAAWSHGEDYGTFSGSGKSIYFRPPNAEITTLAEFQTWLASNNLQIVYPLATPQTIQLTPEEINTLLGENNVWADSGDISVTYVRDLNIAINNLIGE